MPFYFKGLWEWRTGHFITFWYATPWHSLFHSSASSPTMIVAQQLLWAAMFWSSASWGSGYLSIIKENSMAAAWSHYLRAKAWYKAQNSTSVGCSLTASLVNDCIRGERRWRSQGFRSHLAHFPKVLLAGVWRQEVVRVWSSPGLVSPIKEAGKKPVGLCRPFTYLKAAWHSCMVCGPSSCFCKVEQHLVGWLRMFFFFF